MSTPGQPFDYQAFAKQANEQEQAARDGKVAAPVLPVEEKKTEEQPKEENKERRPFSRSDRRKLTTAIKAAEYERGRREATEQLLQQFQRQPEQAKPVSGAPKREDFASDAEYAADVARREVKSEVEKSEARRREDEQINKDVSTANEAHQEQMKYIPDYDSVMDKANKLAGIPADNYIGFFLGTSIYQAHVIEYFVENPDEWNAILALKDNVGKQERMFRQIEGEVRATYKQRKKAAEAPKKEEPKETSAERDAKKAKPSETVTAKGGQPADGTISMMMPDGRTMNPAWKHLQNQKDGLRP